MSQSMTRPHCRPAQALGQMLEPSDDHLSKAHMMMSLDMMHASRPPCKAGRKLCIPAGRANEFVFPADGMTYRLASKATPTAADRCPAALDSSESHALQLLI